MQLSECKDEFGVNEALLSFSEKFVKNIFWFGGALVGFVLKHMLGNEEYVAFANQFSFLAVAIWLAIVMFFFVRLASTKERGKILETLPTPSKQIEELCDDMASDFKLSRREKEVLILLAEGHTQAYVCDYYTLSPGTVKSHVSHIYRKLKIHKREELFDLFETYRQKSKTRRRYDKQ
ncbi:helix-turn-helix transcriptional regulator [Raoultibacter massiliensis]|uniref:LuxR C-terminal-related transcriptional regulator n=1 Tax=Raoultibacter massiliensis TaxID=1852371 RepID=A0ABV1JGU7_9ACTN